MISISYAIRDWQDFSRVEQPQPNPIRKHSKYYSNSKAVTALNAPKVPSLMSAYPNQLNKVAAARPKKADDSRKNWVIGILE